MDYYWLYTKKGICISFSTFTHFSLHLTSVKIPDRDQYCRKAGKASICAADIPYGHWFEFWILRFQSSSLPMTWKGRRRWLKCLGSRLLMKTRVKAPLSACSCLGLWQPYGKFSSSGWSFSVADFQINKWINKSFQKNSQRLKCYFCRLTKSLHNTFLINALLLKTKLKFSGT